MKILLLVLILVVGVVPASAPSAPRVPSPCQIEPWNCARVPPWDRFISWALCVIGGRCPR